MNRVVASLWAVFMLATTPHAQDNKPSFQQVFFEDAKTVYLLARQGENTFVVRTLDSGNTWKWSRLSNHIIKIRFISKTVGWAVGSAGTVLSTTDGGDSWLAQNSGTDETLYDVSSLDTDHVWVVGGHGILLTSLDSGKHWTLRHIGFDAALTGVKFLNNQRGWVVAYGAILSTFDGGLTWTTMSSGSLKSLMSITFINQNSGFITTDSSSILVTDNGGRKWRELLVPGHGRSVVTFLDALHGWAVASAPGSSGYVIGEKSGGPSSKIFVTSNGGRSWRQQFSIITDERRAGWLSDIIFLDRTRGAAVGSDGLLLTTTNGGKLWKKKYLGPELKNQQ